MIMSTGIPIVNVGSLSVFKKILLYYCTVSVDTSTVCECYRVRYNIVCKI